MTRQAARLRRMPWGMRWRIAARILDGDFNQISQTWEQGGRETLVLETNSSLERRYQA